ncbi:ABC transporter permease [Microvirga arabica]|uniref:ABC transporter permease n=1 Tax=Microvirga arabica TaxID=1128671 RepID=A0ABV6Y2Z0_9HYPH
MTLKPSRKDWQRAADDLLTGVGAWQMWLLLGLNDIRQRYKRSYFGQFWITLSTGIFVAGIGVVYAFLFKHPVDEYIPYLAVNFIFWTFISGILSDSTSVFTQAGAYLSQQALPKTAFVMRIIVRQLLVLVHNFVIILLVYLVFGISVPATILFVLPALAVLLLAAFLAATTIGLLCTRFRDLPQIIQSLLQIAFFLTPIMWRVEQLGDRAPYIVGYNPFAIFLMLVTDPLRGQWPSLDLYGRALIIIALMTLVAAPLFARFRARIVYWL